MALAGGSIYLDPWSEPIHNGVLLIAEDRIVAAGPRGVVRIPEDAAVIDCSDAIITAGFWNSHVHLTERKWADANSIPAAELQLQLQDFTRYGFTTVFDLSSLHGNTKAIRRRIDSGEVDGPRILSCGEGIVPPGATPPDTVTRMMGWMTVPMPEVDGPESAAAITHRLLDQRVDGIKLFASGPPSLPESALSCETMNVAVRAAHAANVPVFVHPNTADDIRRAVEARVDVIAHTVPRSKPSKAELAAMCQGGIALIPTLTLWKQAMRHDRASMQRDIVDTALEQLAFFHDAGGTILFGTDHGAVDPDPREEYLLMAQAGMKFCEILASLTTAPSQRFCASETSGTLAPGNPADVVVLNGNSERPDIFALVRLTIRAGRIIHR